MSRPTPRSAVAAAALALASATLLGCASEPAANPGGTTTSGAGPTSSAESAPSATGAPMIGLTFDDGPSTTMTPRVLDLLDKHGIKATFFLQGKHVDAHPDLAREVVERGHVVGNHSYTHPRFTQITAIQADEEILRTNAAIKKATGVDAHLFRYPHGEESQGGNEAIRREKMWGGILWHWATRDKGDFECPGADGLKTFIVNNATDQGLILLHDGNEVKKCGVEQLDGIDAAIVELKKKGYEFGVAEAADGPSSVNQQSWVKVVAPSGAAK